MATLRESATMGIMGSSSTKLSWPDPREIPDRPGCYTFIDSEGTVLYVGKAVSLRGRLADYRQGRLHGNMARVLAEASQVTWLPLPSDADALWAEAQMIAQMKPKYNLRVRTNPSPYPYIVITGEDCPRVLTWRGSALRARPGKGQGRSFGPFPTQARALAEGVASSFGLRPCASAKFRQHQRMARPCLLGETGTCSAPCVEAVGYADRVRAATAFLEGNTAVARESLTVQMEQASRDRKFEHAAVLRDRLELLSGYQARRSLAEVPGRVDAVGISGDEAGWCCAVVHLKDGILLGSTGWEVERAEAAAEDSDEQALALAVARCWDSPEHGLPDRVLSRAAHAELESLVHGAHARTGARSGSGTVVRAGRTDGEKALVRVAEEHAVEQLAASRRARLRDSQLRAAELLEVARLIGAETLWKVECLDVSHWRGTDTVAALSVLVDGLAVDEEELTYRIGEGEDDYASMYKAVAWRASFLQGPGAGPRKGSARGPARVAPDLLLVDGGPGQVAAAAAACAEAGIDLRLAGLSKRLEEIWLPGQEDPIIVPRSSAGLYLLQRARDRAHNLAISRQRSLRRKALLAGGLSGIPGLGKARANRLLAEGGVEPLLGLNAEQIKQARPWLPRSTCSHLASRLALPQSRGA